MTGERGADRADGHAELVGMRRLVQEQGEAQREAFLKLDDLRQSLQGLTSRMGRLEHQGGDNETKTNHLSESVQQHSERLAELLRAKVKAEKSSEFLSCELERTNQLLADTREGLDDALASIQIVRDNLSRASDGVRENAERILRCTSECENLWTRLDAVNTANQMRGERKSLWATAEQVVGDSRPTTAGTRVSSRPSTARPSSSLSSRPPSSCGVVEGHGTKFPNVAQRQLRVSVMPRSAERAGEM